MHYKAYPYIQIDSLGTYQVDDTVYAQNLFLKFAGVTDNRKIKLGIKESEKAIDYVTLKAYLFPYINLVWLGLVVMALGLLMSMVQRTKISTRLATAILLFAGIGLFYMFFVAGG
jgi:cytochrome c-type biogenesis protein CcmF